MTSNFIKPHFTSNYIRWNWSTKTKDIGTVYLIIAILIYLLSSKNFYSLLFIGVILICATISLLTAMISLKIHYKNLYWLSIGLITGGWFLWPIFIFAYNLFLFFMFHDCELISGNVIFSVESSSTNTDSNSTYTSSESFKVKMNPSYLPLASAGVAVATIYVTKKPLAGLGAGAGMHLSSMAYTQAHGFATAYRAKQQAEIQREAEQQRHINDMEILQLKHKNHMEVIEYRQKFKDSLSQQDELALRKKYNLPINNLDNSKSSNNLDYSKSSNNLDYSKSSNNSNLESENINLDSYNFNEDLTLFIFQTYNNAVLTLLLMNVLILIFSIFILLNFYVNSHRANIVNYLTEKNWVNLKKFVEFQYKVSSFNRWLLIILVFVLIFMSLLLLFWMYLVPLPVSLK